MEEEKNREIKKEDIQKENRKKRPEGAGEERRRKRPEGAGEERRRKRPEGAGEERRRKRPEGAGEERRRKHSEGMMNERPKRRPEGMNEEQRRKRPKKEYAEHTGIQAKEMQSEHMAGKSTGHKKKTHRRGPRKRHSKGSKAAGVISKIILIIALAVFAYSAYQLFDIYYGYHKGETEYDEIEKTVVSIDQEEADRYQVDFDALKEINPDVVAWIRFDEPAIINYPVVQGKDNSEYLSKTFKGYENTVGTIFVNVDNNPDFTDRNTIIYGHHMNNGTMFNELDEYESEEFWKKYPCFYIYTPDGAQLKYQIYSAGIVKDIAENYTYEFADDEAFRSFLQITKESSFYDTGVEPDLDSKIVTLSTCTKANNDERLVVHGMLVEVKN